MMKEKTQNGQFQADKHDFSYLDPDQQAKSYFVLQKKINTHPAPALDLTFMDTDAITMLTHFFSREVNQSNHQSLVKFMMERVFNTPGVNGESLSAVILSESAMKLYVNGINLPTYIKRDKEIPLVMAIATPLKDKKNGVRVMERHSDLEGAMHFASRSGVQAIQLRSELIDPDEKGIAFAVQDQVNYASEAFALGIKPMFTFKIKQNNPHKAEIENLLYRELDTALDMLEDKTAFINMPLPDESGFYEGFVNHPNVSRLFGNTLGMNLNAACATLEKNKGVAPALGAIVFESMDLSMPVHQFENQFTQGIYLMKKSSAISFV